MDFSGAKPQTFIFDNDIAIQQKNIGITEAFIQGLGSPKVSENKTGLFWTDVKLDKIMSELLINKFSFSNRSRVFNEIGVFCDWIKQIASENSLANWTVILAGNDTVKMINQATVIFVNGCFWHGHEGCKYFVWPENNAEFWRKKIVTNISRDERKKSQLEEMGWNVIVVWECELRPKERQKTLEKLEKELYQLLKKE